jgi:hypothetical protein
MTPSRLFGSGTNGVTFASNYGDQLEYYSGVDINLNARLRGGAFLGGRRLAERHGQLLRNKLSITGPRTKTTVTWHPAARLADRSLALQPAWKITRRRRSNVAETLITRVMLPTATVNALGRNPNSVVTCRSLPRLSSSRINQTTCEGRACSRPAGPGSAPTWISTTCSTRAAFRIEHHLRDRAAHADPNRAGSALKLAATLLVVF